jgi:DNA polymerase elongation subunit (family B)
MSGTTATRPTELRLYDFAIKTSRPHDTVEEEDDPEDDPYDGAKKPFGDKDEFVVEAYGIDPDGRTAYIVITGYRPQFYVLVGDTWGSSEKDGFITSVRQHLGAYYNESIVSAEYVSKKTLYGFDGDKYHKFLRISFTSIRAMAKAKQLWFYRHMYNGKSEQRLRRDGYVSHGFNTRIYESSVPPLLRLFHTTGISPSGWIRLPTNRRDIKHVASGRKITSCDYEVEVAYNTIVPLPDKETPVPYKICSFDIEASSSHGDFPIPKKQYTKLAAQLLDAWTAFGVDAGMSPDEFIVECLLAAFGYSTIHGIAPVYLKCRKDGVAATISEPEVRSRAAKFLKRGRAKSPATILVDTMTFDRQERYDMLTGYLDATFPPIQGDRCTMIGATFMRYGDSKANTNICLVAGACDPLPPTTGPDGAPVANSVVKYIDPNPDKEEKKLILGFTRLIAKQNPHLIVSYNGFGFDWAYLHARASELGCLAAFLQLSFKKHEICCPPPRWTPDQPEKDLAEDDAWDDDGDDDDDPVDGGEGGGTGGDDAGAWSVSGGGGSAQTTHPLTIKTSVLAAGQFDLAYVAIPGRVQVDLLTYYRREENLASYRLDAVSAHYIGDTVTTIEWIEEEDEEGVVIDKTIITSKNLLGIDLGTYVRFEEVSHTTEDYDDGRKFEVVDIDRAAGTFEILGIADPNTKTAKVRWCIGKDDIDHKDIFRLSNGSTADRAIVVKYCIQDCNLLHQLFNKTDVMNNLLEMARLCMVPIDFLVQRGQGIKLQSYVASKCREKDTLMPDIERDYSGSGYEGAVVLNPRTGIYLDKPVFCVDYSSLYPSSMISENISHDSKVWTKEYDLDWKLVRTTGAVDASGNYIYDNLPEYRYVDIDFNLYRNIRKTEKGAAIKTHTGYKVCRWAQRTDGASGVMPAILKELLQARKDTRKKIKTTNDPFMKNILDKRQLSIKVTANSIYGQTGASTSKFAEQDVAASTTAIGRKLLGYAERLINDVYGDRVCAIDPTKIPETELTEVRTRCVVVYGDTDSVFACFNLERLDGTSIVGKEALAITIYLGLEVERLASSMLKAPHTLEYEKTFMPFCLLSKKRYVGMLYETDVNSGSRKSMGLVLKRRDNAGIVKEFYGGVVDIIMRGEATGIAEAFAFVIDHLEALVAGKVDIKKLLISKSLRGFYKMPKQIAHKVLADRIAMRAPGSEPTAGDRMDFAYIVNSNKDALQGDRIETPAYIADTGLEIDYGHYISNQLMKPLSQLFALVLEDLPGFERKRTQFARIERTVEAAMADGEPDKLRAKIEKLRMKEVEVLMFGPSLRITENRAAGRRAITDFF